MRNQLKDYRQHKLKFNPYLEKLYQSDKPISELLNSGTELFTIMNPLLVKLDPKTLDLQKIKQVKITKGWNVISFNSPNINLNIMLELYPNIKEIKSKTQSYNRNVDSKFNTLKKLEVNSEYYLYSDIDFILKIN